MYDVKQLQEMIESSVRDHSLRWENTSPVNLYAPVTYSLSAGGKRIRPLLVLLAYQLKGDHPEEALPVALAMEVFHNFTLLHDDIMDKAEIRRNQPTVHRKFSENNAILSGDVMAFLAYRFLLESKPDQWQEIISLFTQTAIEICEGQQMDIDFEERMDVSSEEYLTMIRLKTAVLLGCAMKAGALAGGMGPTQARILYDAGVNLGLAFQLQDDLLDTFGDENIFGKKIGGDIISNKKTFLLTEALQRAEGNNKEELLRWLGRNSFDRDEKVAAVRTVFKELCIRERAENTLDGYYTAAMALLETMDSEVSRMAPLLLQCRKLIGRKS